MAGRWWKVGLLGLLFWTGMASGLLVRRGVSRGPAEMVTRHDEAAFDLYDEPPQDPMVPSTLDWSPEQPPFAFQSPEPTPADDEIVVPSRRARGPIVTPEEIAVDTTPPLPPQGPRLALTGGEPDAPLPPPRRDDGPQLHPPDAPTADAPPSTRRPDLPTRTAEKDAGVPGKLSLPERAARLPASPERSDAALKALIEKELPDASPQEKEVWMDELRGVPPSTAHALLELRRRLGSTRDHHPSREPVTLPPAAEADLARGPNHLPPAAWPKDLGDDGPRTHAPLPVPHEFVNPMQPLEATMTALRHARTVLMNNIANAHTDGFKKSCVEFAERGYTRRREKHAGEGGVAPFEAAFGDGIAIATRIDFSQGPVRKTGRSLDIAIDGPGWFMVRDQDTDARFYTRCGRLQINEFGELAVRRGSTVLLFDPPVTVPPDAAEVRFGEDGVIEVKQPNNDERTQIGQIQLAKFNSDDRLVPCGHGLFKPVEESPPMMESAGSPGYGKLRSGCLEGSNVDVKAELDELRRIQSLARTLMEAMRLMRDDEPDAPASDAHVSAHSACCGAKGSCSECPACRRAKCAGESCPACREGHCESGECPKCRSGACPAAAECPDECNRESPR